MVLKSVNPHRLAFILAFSATMLYALRFYYSLLYYEIWLMVIKANPSVRIMNAKEYYSSKPNGSIVVIRHDVDEDPEKAMLLAYLELKHSVTSSYYFRLKDLNSSKEIIAWLLGNGFEVGIHYEDDDLAKALKLLNCSTVSAHSGTLPLSTLPDGVIGDVSRDIAFSDEYSAVLPLDFNGKLNIVLVHPDRWHKI